MMIDNDNSAKNNILINLFHFFDIHKYGQHSSDEMTKKIV